MVGGPREMSIFVLFDQGCMAITESTALMWMLFTKHSTESDKLHALI